MSDRSHLRIVCIRPNLTVETGFQTPLAKEAAMKTIKMAIIGLIAVTWSLALISSVGGESPMMQGHGWINEEYL